MREADTEVEREEIGVAEEAVEDHEEEVDTHTLIDTMTTNKTYNTAQEATKTAIRAIIVIAKLNL